MTATRTHLVDRVPTEGSSWRLRSLDADAAARGSKRRRYARGPVRDAAWDALDARMLTLLSTDGRMPIRRLAEELDTSVTTAGRRLRQLVGTRISLRCDVARPVSGWPLAAVYFASAPADKLRETSQALASVPEVRSCAITAGPHNLVIDVWLRSLPDVHSLEAHLCAHLPPLRVGRPRRRAAHGQAHGAAARRRRPCRGVVPLDWSIT